MKNLVKILILYSLTSCSSFFEKQNIPINKPNKDFALKKNSSIYKSEYWKIKNKKFIDNKDKDFKLFLEVKSEWLKFYNSNITKTSSSSLQINELEKSFANLPKHIQEKIENRVHAFVLIEGLGVSQFIVQTQDQKFIVFIDKNINAKGLNDWYLDRELTSMSELDSSIKMNPLLSFENSRYDTILFLYSQSLLLILAQDEELLNEFRNISWDFANEVIISKWHKYFNEIGFVNYYGQAVKKVNFDKSYEFHQLLEKTDFVNLYSTSSPQRDFIETGSIYIYNILLTKPFHIEFLEENIMLDSFSSCLKNARCLKKRQFFEQLLKPHK